MQYFHLFLWVGQNRCLLLYQLDRNSILWCSKTMWSSLRQIKTIRWILFSHETLQISNPHFNHFICIFLGFLDFRLQNIKLRFVEISCFNNYDLQHNHMVCWNPYRFSRRTSNKLFGRIIIVRRTSIHAKNITSNFIINFSQWGKFYNLFKIEFKGMEIVDNCLENFDLLLNLVFLSHLS